MVAFEAQTRAQVDDFYTIAMAVSLRIAINRICQANCHAESCGNALYDVACSSGTSARLFPGERDGRSLAQ